MNILVFSNATAAQRRWTKTFTAKNTYIKCQFPGDSIRRALPIAVDAHADMERVVCVGGGVFFFEASASVSWQDEARRAAPFLYSVWTETNLTV